MSDYEKAQRNPNTRIPERRISPKVGDFNNRSKSNPVPNKAVKSDPKPPSK